MRADLIRPHPQKQNGPIEFRPLQSHSTQRFFLAAGFTAFFAGTAFFPTGAGFLAGAFFGAAFLAGATFFTAFLAGTAFFGTTFFAGVFVALFFAATFFTGSVLCAACF